MSSPAFTPPQPLHPPRHRQTHHPASTPPTNMSAQPTRRAFLLQSPAIVALSTLLTSSTNLHAQLSDLTSKLPGMGMTDVFYPAFFEGEWTVSRELYSLQTNPDGIPDMPGHSTLGGRAIEAARRSVGRRDTYIVRFVMHRGKIIEDRLYNSRAEAVAQNGGGKISCAWDADNPNVTTVSGAGGVLNGVREIVVTKRAFVDAPQGHGTFVSSEYARVVDVDDDGALLGFGKPPSVFAKRTIVRYRVNSVNERLSPDGMDRLVVEYLYPPSPVDAAPAVTLKYREFLNKKVVR